MSYYIAFDDMSIIEFASNGGYYDLIEWGNSLPVKSFPNLTAMIYHGYTTDLYQTRVEYERAAVRYRPNDADTRGVIAAVIRLLRLYERRSDIAIFSNGLVPRDSGGNTKKKASKTA